MGNFEVKECNDTEVVRFEGYGDTGYYLGTKFVRFLFFTQKGDWHGGLCDQRSKNGGCGKIGRDLFILC